MIYENGPLWGKVWKGTNWNKINTLKEKERKGNNGTEFHFWQQKTQKFSPTKLRKKKRLSFSTFSSVLKHFFLFQKPEKKVPTFFSGGFRERLRYRSEDWRGNLFITILYSKFVLTTFVLPQYNILNLFSQHLFLQNWF